MTGRDLLRFALALTAIIILDGILFAALGLPLDSDEESIVLALGYTLLCAIRDRDCSGEASETPKAVRPEGQKPGPRSGIAQPEARS